jgi:leader peptidase (prepilin peptidase) / N-methyltransferase
MSELALVFFVAVLAVISVVDVRERRVPNRIVLPATGLLLAVQFALDPARGLEATVAAFGAYAFMLALVLLNPKGLGMGDAKLAAFMGAGLGGGVLAALVIGSGLAAAFGVAQILRGGLAARHSTFPFAPFLAGGSAVVLLLA